MKILHIAPDPSAAWVPARVIHGIAQNVTPAWTATPAAALLWLQGNRDTAAVIAEVEPAGCAAFVEQLRALGLTTPVVIVSGSPRLEPALAALKAGADGFVVAGPSLETALPRAVTAAIEHDRSHKRILMQSLPVRRTDRDAPAPAAAPGEQPGIAPPRNDATELAAATERLADVEARHSVSLARETRICMALQQRLFELETELRKADERRAAEAVAAADQLAKRHAEFTASLAQAAQSRDAVAAELSVATAALEDARQARKADAAAAAEQFRRREADLHVELAEALAGRLALENALADAAAAQQDTRQRAASDLAAANERQAALEDLLSQETDRRTSLDRKLTAVEAAHHEAERRHAAVLVDLQARYDAAVQESAVTHSAFAREMAAAASALEQANQQRTAEAAAAATQLAGVQTELDARLSDAASAKTELERTLAETQSALEHANEQRAAETAAAAAQLAGVQTELDARLTVAASAKTELERTLAETQSALEHANQQRTAEAATAAAQLAAIKAELDARLADAATANAALERTLAETRAAHEHGMQRAAEDLAFAAAREGALEERLTQAAGTRTRLEQQLSAAESVRVETERRHTAALAAAAAQLDALQTQHATAVAEHAAANAVLEQRLADNVTAQREAEDRTAAALATAAAREAELVDLLARESAARAMLERDLTGVRRDTARRRARTRRVVTTYRRRAEEEKVRLLAQLAGERTDAARELGARDEEIRQAHAEHERLRRLLGSTQDQLQHLHGTVEEERQAHEHARQTSESELQRVAAEYGQIRQSFDRLQSAFQTLEQVAGEHAAERARLETVVVDRDSQLSAQAERHRVADQAAQDAYAALQERLRQALVASGAEIARLQQEIDALGREVDATRTHAEALRGVAERVPELQTQLERSQSETRRQFERAPYALCRCSDSGAITAANHSFVKLLGYRRADELRNVDFVRAARESGGDLSWLLERARTTRKTETVELQWRARDGRSLVLRLQALANSTGTIEIVAEDITELRAHEERLRQAERMEAVGRLAAEVAVTCDAMLSDVARGADEWLARVGGDDVLRRHAERLLTDVMRASSFLRQLGTYGNEQVRALQPVSAQRVLRDLAPVLKRLVGDQIELVLPKSGGPFNVDVEAERLERVLINVAGYARQRMPAGGQIRIDLATTAVGRRFVARYANVRPGDHVLITVTELSAERESRADGERGSRASDQPGVDLGVLVDLIASCGGHLWLEAQPAGNMVVKMHLPKAPATPAPENRGRLSKWFRSTPVLKVFA